MYYKVDGDVHCIAKRLKQIDEHYVIVYNGARCKVEVHNTRMWRELGFNTFCFVVPFDEIDCRVIEHTRRTRVENLDDIQADIDKHNEYLQGSAGRKLDSAKIRLDDMLAYAHREDRNINFNNTKKWF